MPTTTTKTGRSFPFISQNGPFATRDQAPTRRPFSAAGRAFAKGLRAAGLTSRYRVTRNLIFDFLDIDSLAAIDTLRRDAADRRRLEKRGYALLGRMFGIDGTERETIAAIAAYSRTADAVIRYLRNTALSQYASHVEMTNEIDLEHSPVALLLIIFDDRYHKKARFEARRKLLFMNLAASIDQRERETGIEENFARFLDFLNTHVWSPGLKIGELDISYLHSRHDAKTFRCREVKVIGPEKAARIKPGKGEKLTLIKRRLFRDNGRDIPIYVSIRKKSPETKVLKLLRKGEENPAVAVDDELGLMAVVESLAEVRAFLRHLTRCAIATGSFMTFEEVSDTLTGGRHESGSIGSSPGTPMFKFFARMGGMRVEFIIHTHRTYLNYIYQRGVSHDEYEVRRIFDSGVAELLFPRDIYHVDLNEAKKRQLDLCRRRIEG